MKKTTLAAAVAAIGLMLGAAPALAEDGHAGHEMMQSNAAAADEIPVKAVINSIDAASLKANVTHEAIPALHWPQMTMDLPVTKKVDLAAVKPGMNAVISLKQGMDGQYRITDIRPAE